MWSSGGQTLRGQDHLFKEIELSTQKNTRLEKRKGSIEAAISEEGAEKEETFHPALQPRRG